MNEDNVIKMKKAMEELSSLEKELKRIEKKDLLTRLIVGSIVGLGFALGDDCLFSFPGWHGLVLNLTLAFFYGCFFTDYFLNHWCGGSIRSMNQNQRSIEIVINGEVVKKSLH